MKKNFEKIFNTTITIIGIIIIALAVKVINVEAHSYTEAVVSTPVAKEVEKAYSAPSVTYKKINNFPINASVFNSDSDFFCIQHGVAYGIGNAPNRRGDDWVSGECSSDLVGASPDFHTSNGDVGEYIKIKDDGTTDVNVETLTNLGIQGYKDSSETPKSSTYSNYYYKIFKNLKFGCEVEEYPTVKVVNPTSGAEETKTLTFDGGLAFLLARYKLTDADRASTTYQNDPLQHAVWASLGQLDSYALKDAKAQFNKYHEDVQNTEKLPDVFPADDVGAVLDGTNYVVGPFKMNNYVRATDYVYEVKGVVQQDDYLVDPDALDASGEPINSNVDMGEKNLQMDFGDEKDLYGGILEAKVIFNDGSEYVFANFDNKNVPAPNEEFNITIPESSIPESADEIKDIQFTYQIIHAYGEGEAYIGRQLVVSWSEETSKTEDGCSTYKCTQCQNSNVDKGNRSYIGGTHTVHCGGSGYCSDGYLNGFHPGELQCGKTEHTHTSSCYHTHSSSCKNEAGVYICGESENSPNCGKTAHTHSYDCYCCGDTSYCVHGHSSGIHSGTCQSWGTSHDDEHVGHTVCLGHSHEDCKKITWKADSIYYDKCQDGAALAGELTNSIDKYTVRVEVPLKTDMTIYKYITKVEHQTDKGAEHATCGRTYNGGDERREWTIDQKKGDTVKVERGDKVYFKIELVNASRFPTKVLVKDTLPDSIQDPTRSDPKITWSTESTEDAWIIVEPKSTAEFEVTVIVNADSGAYVNKVEFVSLNEQEPHMKYSEWGDTATHGKHYNGNIVNINDTRLKDEDWYEVKEYDVSLDKNIIEVKHTTTNEATYSGTDRKNIEEDLKEANPVYAEYGDTVTYEIDIYNTTQPYTDDRTAEPYWEPEVAFVNIEDKLPNKYTDLTVEVSNGSGEITTAADSFTVENIKVDPDSKTTVKVTLIVNEHVRETIEKNTVKIKDKVKNINRYEIKNNPTKDETADYYKINDYNISINKYISDYDMKVMKENNSSGFTNEESIVSDRSEMTEEEKKDRPLQVEKGETVTYTIRLDNEAVTTPGSIPSSDKPATKVRPNEILESLQTGLEFKSVTAKVYTASGSDKYGDIPVSYTDEGNNTYKLTIPNEIGGNMLILEPGEYITYLVNVGVTESNMYLYELTNTAVITKLTNVNHTDSVPREVKNEDYDENIAEPEDKTSSDYVKMKDLVIAGRVWLDNDKDGYMDLNASKQFDNYIDVEGNPSSHVEYTDGSTEYAMKNIVVRLYTKDGTFVRATKTDEQGKFTFGKDENGTGWLPGTYSYEGSVTESDERIPKANGKDANKNYTESSTLIDYYIEYYYDGVRYKSTTVYSGKTHLDENGNMDSEGLYEIDSNATESKEIREEFNKKFEIIAFDKAYNGSLTREEELSYTKEGHNSWLNINHLRGSDGGDVEGIMRARSFLIVDSDGNDTGTDYLWLFKQGADYQLPETDYLKFINLGLEERLMDLKLTEDVYEVKTTINGEQMTYEYNQNEYVSGNASIDKTHETDDYNSEYYMTGYVSDASTLKNYDFRIYNSDYDYKYTQYPVDTVRDYKTKDSELNIEATFRIKVTNNKPDDTIESDVGCYAGINEIVQYYDKDFVDVDFNADGTVKTLNIKTKDANGYLQDTALNIVKAEYVMSDGTRKEAVLSKDSKYNTTRSLGDLYDTLYIRPQSSGSPLAGDIIIAQEESVDILITFVVDKKSLPDMSASDLYVILGDKINIAEISAYSTYYKKADGTYYSAGLVDQDSNPGNFGEMFTLSADKNVDSQEYLALFEDDTFKSGISMILQQKTGGPGYEEEKERMLTGFVWDDSRSEVALNVDGTANTQGDQYIGDGKYDTSVDASSRQPNARRNQAVSNKEVNDIVIQDMKAQMVEIVRIPETDASGNITGEKVYEQTIKTSNDSIMEARTAADGKYKFKEYIPGEYVVKFAYGDDASYQSMVIFNGQDYKSTTYQAGESSYAETITNPDDVLDLLEKPNISDAKDDEIKRLETISYSETMTNELNRILRGINSSNVDALINNTNMESETAKFLVRTEKEKGAKVTLTYSETMDKFIKNTRHPIQNIDFGIEYRPEHQVGLEKYISNVKIITSDAGENGTPLVDAKFKEFFGIVAKTDVESGATEFLKDTNGNVVEVDRNANKSAIEAAASNAGVSLANCETTANGDYIITLAGTKLDEENSVGLVNLQYLANDYEFDDSGIVDAAQGFIYMNIDDDIMQGASIKIEYVFSGINLSEVDRVNSRLSELRFRENDAVVSGYTGTNYYDEIAMQMGATDMGYTDVDYSGARTARNKLFSEYYRYELNGATKKLDDNGNEIVYRIKNKNIGTTDSDYYGRYMGSVYYTGKINGDDTVAELKIDKVLDYIDNDLVFNVSENMSNDHAWATTTSAELEESHLVQGSFRDRNTGSILPPLTGGVILDNKNRAYDTPERSNLAMLIDDRVKDYLSGETDITKNKDISKFLLPRTADGQDSYGLVKLTASKVIAAEDLKEDMNYENIAEIVQYSSVTGRVTNLATTLGNVTFWDDDDPANPIPEWDEGNSESDTAVTEKVTLTPPTGLGRIQRTVRQVTKNAGITLVVVIVVALACVGVVTAIKLYRKRVIK